MNKVFFVKTSSGEYVELEFSSISEEIKNNWNNSLVLVRVCSENGKELSEEEVSEVMRTLETADALRELKDTTFIIADGELSFETIFPDSFSREDQIKLMKHWVEKDPNLTKEI